MKYIGIDMHKDICQVVCVSEEGKVVDSRKISSSLHSLDMHFGGMKDVKIAIEASTHARPVYKHLKKLGLEVHVANPRKLQEIASSKKKTDERDALILAQMLRVNYLPCCYVPDEETEAMRTLIRHRVSLGQKLTAVKNQTHAVLAANGIKLGLSDIFTEYGKKAMVRLHLPSEYKFALESNVKEIGFLQREIEIADTRIASIAKDSEEVKQLMQIPGVDYYSALGEFAEIGDVKRFPNAKKLVSYAGLAPGVRKSGKREKHGRITHEGPAILRWLLVCNAHAAIKVRESKLRRFYLRLEKRIGKNKAIVAVARKLLVIIYAMLTTGRPYEERRDDLLYRKLAKLQKNAAKNIKSSKQDLDLQKKGIETIISYGGEELGGIRSFS